MISTVLEDSGYNIYFIITRIASFLKAELYKTVGRTYCTNINKCKVITHLKIPYFRVQRLRKKNLLNMDKLDYREKIGGVTLLSFSGPSGL